VSANVEQHILSSAYGCIAALTDLLEEFAGDVRDPVVVELRELSSELAKHVPAQLAEEAVQRREYLLELRRRLASRRAG
jgi:hypothetical protein